MTCERIKGRDVALGSRAPIAFTNSKFRESGGLGLAWISVSFSKSSTMSSSEGFRVSGKPSASRKGRRVVYWPTLDRRFG